MNFDVIKSKYTEKDVKKFLKFLTFKSIFKMIPVKGTLGIIVFILNFLFVSLWYRYNMPNCEGNARRVLIIAMIPAYLCCCVFGVSLYQELIGKKKKIILGYYKEADRLCEDLLTDQIKSGFYHVDIYIDTQRNELVAIIKGDNFAVKRVYHFGRCLQQIIDKEKKVIDLSKLDSLELKNIFKDFSLRIHGK